MLVRPEASRLMSRLVSLELAERLENTKTQRKTPSQRQTTRGMTTQVIVAGGIFTGLHKREGTRGGRSEKQAQQRGPHTNLRCHTGRVYFLFF